MPWEPLAAGDLEAMREQLGRPMRSVRGVGHRCPCGNPTVVVTDPQLEDGTPFPTTFYVTCPRVSSRLGTFESSGLMKEMTQRLETDPELAAAYAQAHEAYLQARAELGEQPAQIEGISAGGMPTRVKCLHVLVGQSLAQGLGVNPLGDEALEAIDGWWKSGPCVCADRDQREIS